MIDGKRIRSQLLLSRADLIFVGQHVYILNYLAKRLVYRGEELAVLRFIMRKQRAMSNWLSSTVPPPAAAPTYLDNRLLVRQQALAQSFAFNPRPRSHQPALPCNGTRKQIANSNNSSSPNPTRYRHLGLFYKDYLKLLIELPADYSPGTGKVAAHLDTSSPNCFTSGRASANFLNDANLSLANLPSSFCFNSMEMSTAL